jgi:hypothetical protein
MDEILSIRNGLLAEPLWKFFLLAALATLLVAVFVWARVRQPSQLLAFTTGRGKVFLSRKAVSGMIARVAARTNGVVRCRSRLRERKGRLDISLKIRILADADLREIQHRLEIQIVDVLNRNLGFDRLGAITTRAVAVEGELAQPSSIAAKAAPKNVAAAARAVPGVKTVSA